MPPPKKLDALAPKQKPGKTPGPPKSTVRSKAYDNLRKMARHEDVPPGSPIGDGGMKSTLQRAIEDENVNMLNVSEATKNLVKPLK